MKIYQETNDFLGVSFQILEQLIPPPKPKDLGGELALRYENKSLQVAIVQKLARYISGLNAALVLLRHGYTQELGALFRTLDEFQEDITFLSLPIVSDTELSKLHSEYLESFFQEELDKPFDTLGSSQKRPSIPRQRIRSAISNSSLSDLNPSDFNEVLRTMHHAYRGLVTTAIAGKALGSDKVGEKCYEFMDYFEKTTGDTGKGDPEKMIKKVKKKNA